MVALIIAAGVYACGFCGMLVACVEERFSWPNALWRAALWPAIILAILLEQT